MSAPDYAPKRSRRFFLRRSGRPHMSQALHGGGLRYDRWKWIQRDSTMIEFKGSHFEREVILWGVRWYVAYPISYRQLEEMMEKRGVEVDHSTLNRWVVKYVPLLDQQFRTRKCLVGSSWRLDENYVKVKKGGDRKLQRRTSGGRRNPSGQMSTHKICDKAGASTPAMIDARTPSSRQYASRLQSSSGSINKS